jgi:PAS domain S-box-containing protein
MWVEFWNSLDIFVQTLVKVAAVAPLVWVMWKWVGLGTLVKSIWKWLREVRSAMDSLERLTRFEQKLDNITNTQKEFKEHFRPNGGSSFMDKINKLVAITEELSEGQHQLGERIHVQMQASDKAHFETDKTGQCLWANRTHNRLTGFPMTEVLGDNWINVIAPECRERAFELWNNAVRRGRDFDEFLWYVEPVPEDGHLVRYEVRVVAHPMKDRVGNVLGYLGTVEKTSTPKQTERVTKEQRH